MAVWPMRYSYGQDGVWTGVVVYKLVLLLHGVYVHGIYFFIFLGNEMDFFFLP